MLNFTPYQLDHDCYAIFLELPASKIVLLHAIFESYDGLAAVKTVDVKKHIVSVIATGGTLPFCVELLASIKLELPWRIAATPHDLSELFNYRFQY